MIESETDDYIAKEIETSEKTINEISKSDKILTKDLYPEYKLDNAYCTSLEPYSKIFELLPFRKKLIIHINIELPDEVEFQKWYGVSVEQLIQLKKDGHAEIMINMPQKPPKIPSYLDGILEKKFPTSIRLRKLAENLISEKRKLIDEKITELTKRMPMSIDGLGKITSESKLRIERTTRVACYQLLSLGYEKEVNDVINTSITNPERARKLLDNYRLFLAGPVFYSLHGMHKVSGNAVKQNHLKLEDLNELHKSQIHPSEVASILVDALELCKVRNFTHALDVYPYYEKATNALIELEKYVRDEKNVKDIAGMIDETKKIFNDILPSVEKTRDKTERLIEAVCIGGGLVTGFLALGYPGLITSGIISTLGSRYVAKPLSKKLVTFGTSNSLISIFDFKEDVKHWMGQRKV